MAKNINFVSHKKSKVKLENGKPQLPLASALVEGEIAVNYAKDVETLSIKNESGTVVTFSSDNYYTEQKLGSGFIGTNSAKTVTDVIEENERVVSAALNDLEERKLDASAYTPTDLSNYYKKSETSGATEIANALAQKLNISDFNTYSGAVDTTIKSKASQSDLTTLSGTVTAHTASTSIHLTATEKTNIDSLATNIAAISGITSTKVGNWDTAYTNNHTHSNRTALDSITGNVGTMAYQATSSYSSATQVNTALGNKVDKVNGKGLSTNDYTTDEKNKLSGIASGAQVNVIETVKVNGTALTPSSKAVDVTVPTKTSDLTNDSNFVSDASYVHTDNNYTTTEKNKLSGIAAGAEVNQNAFSNIKVGTTTVAADSKTDTLEISGSGIVTITADATNDKITISASNAVTSVAGKTGVVTLAKSDVGLGNVDNTADANKTVKAATSAQTADTAKAVALSGVTNADDLKAIEGLTGTSGLLKKTAANTWSLDTNSYSTTAVAVTGATYNTTNKTIDLKNAAGTVVSTVDATAFIKDGMVSNVEVKNVASSGTCLVITFNTDAGKDAINIPISQIFDANNYYTKADLTGSSTTVVVAKASSATTAASAGSVALSNVSGADDLKAIEAITGTSGLLKKTAANTWTLDTTDYSNKNAFGKIKINAESTTIDSDTTNDTLTISGGSFVTLTSDATNDKFTIGVSTGTSSSTLARGDHNHDSAYQAKGSYLTGTTTYAGSSTQGGAATSANKLNTNAGNATTPVYFSGGVPTAMSYTIAKSVPSNAVFTDTDTKVTAVGNHYAPSATSADTKSATASSTSELNWGSAVVTGVTLSGDAKGHITSVTVASGKLKTPVTGVTLASGTNNGTVKLTVNGSATDNIAVKGLSSMAYQATSSYSSATQVSTALGSKVDKVSGKGLSTNDYTTDEKNKLSGIAAGAEVNVQSDWNATSGDALILNKPTIPAAANNGTYTVKTLVGTTTTNVSDFTANQSSADDITFVQGTNVTITPDATNRRITIASTYNDSKVEQKIVNTNGEYRILLKANTNNTDETNNSMYASGITVNPSKSEITATNFNGKLNGITPTNNTGTVTSVAAGGGLTGGTITTSGTIGMATVGTAGTYGPTANVTGTEGTTIKIPQITTDAYGRVTSVTERTLTNKNSTYTVNDGKLSLKVNGTEVSSFTANQSAASTFEFTSGASLGDGTIKVNGTSMTVYTHPTTAGNKHIPSGGSSGQFLGWNSDGTAKWVSNPNTDSATTLNGHYTPASSTTITKTASSTTNATWGSSDFVTGITLYKDAKGHITDMAVSSLQLPTPETYSVVTTGTSGLAPILTTTANTIATQASEFVLTTTSGGVPSWRKLPANAFNNTTYTAGSFIGINGTTISAKTGTTDSTLARGDHSHASNKVTAMTGYSLPASGSAIATSDTLNAAIGKLEARIAYLESCMQTISEALNELNAKMPDIQIDNISGKNYKKLSF